MSLFVASLNSGSNGNCYYVGNQSEGVLIDSGISCRETERRLKRLGLSIKMIKAIFITHEHTDHIYGLTTLSKKHRIPVYITPDTLYYGKLKIQQDHLRNFKAYEIIRIGGLNVCAFPKFHDASDPHSFIIESNTQVRVGIFTDIGLPCEHVIKHFSQCHAAFLESNYDEYMLENGSYPYHLKNRIRGGRGHLSNDQAMKLFIEHRPAFMSHLFLSHLSQENNSPKLVKNLFSKIADRVQVIVASRERETNLYHIRSGMTRSNKVIQPVSMARTQLSLF